MPVGGQLAGQNFRDRFRQRFSGTLNVLLVRVHIDAGCCRHARMPQLQLRQFHVSRYRTNDAAARMTEDVKSMRPFAAINCRTIHRRIEARSLEPNPDGRARHRPCRR